MRLPRVNQGIFQNALDACVRSNKVEVEKDKVKVPAAVGETGNAIREDEEVVLKVLLKYNLTPPGLKELSVETGKKEKDLKDILNRLNFQGKAVKIKGDMYFHRDAIEDLKLKAVSYLKTKKEMTPSDFKSVVDVSRKYMIPLLEYLDEIKLTIRTGDKRILRS
jgi:selenocysteine-specific elongation factor